jgi:hypothetical protein
MSAVLLALFDDYAKADRARTELVVDGFPTDRVELTASCEPGRAVLEPATTLHDKFTQYFAALLGSDRDRELANSLADRIDGGAAAVAVHPRGAVETARANQVLEALGAAEIAREDLDSQSLEFAAARSGRAWLSYFWSSRSVDSHCVYCWLFEQHPH